MRRGVVEGMVVWICLGLLQGRGREVRDVLWHIFRVKATQTKSLSLRVPLQGVGRFTKFRLIASLIGRANSASVIYSLPPIPSIFINFLVRLGKVLWID